MHLHEWLFLSVVILLLLPMRRAQVSTNRHHRLDPLLSQPASPSPYWEHILREFVFKTISPPPPGNHVLYKKLLEAPFFGGPFPVAGNDDTTLLSKGIVYHLANSRWILCQDGCIDCDICTEQKSPTVKWTLRRIKRHSGHNSARYDLQLTIAPQKDGSFHMTNLWPRSYVYVTSHTRPTSSLPEELVLLNKEYPFIPTAQSDPERKQPSSNRLNKNVTPSADQQVKQNHRECKDDEDAVFRSSFASQDSGDGDRSTFSNQATAKMILPENKCNHELFAQRGHLRNNPSMKRIMPHNKALRQPAPLLPLHPSHNGNNATSETITSARPAIVRRKDPHLILGTDQYGQKHLVHIVPADHAADVLNFTTKPVKTARFFNSQPGPMLATQPAELVDEIEKLEFRPSYQKIFRKVMDSLNTHRDDIEEFLFPAKPARSSSNANRKSSQHMHQQMVSETISMETIDTPRLDPTTESTANTFPVDQKKKSNLLKASRDLESYDFDSDSEKEQQRYKSKQGYDGMETPIIPTFPYNAVSTYYNSKYSSGENMRTHNYPINIGRRKISAMRQFVKPHSAALPSSKDMENIADGNSSDSMSRAAKKFLSNDPHSGSVKEQQHNRTIHNYDVTGSPIAAPDADDKLMPHHSKKSSNGENRKSQKNSTNKVRRKLSTMRQIANPQSSELSSSKDTKTAVVSDFSDPLNAAASHRTSNEQEIEKLWKYDYGSESGKKQQRYRTMPDYDIAETPNVPAIPYKTPFSHNSQKSSLGEDSGSQKYPTNLNEREESVMKPQSAELPFFIETEDAITGNSSYPLNATADHKSPNEVKVEELSINDHNSESGKEKYRYKAIKDYDVTDDPIRTTIPYKMPLSYDAQRFTHREDYETHKHLKNMDKSKQPVQPRSFSIDMENAVISNFSYPSHAAANYKTPREEVEKTYNYYHNLESGKEDQLYKALPNFNVTDNQIKTKIPYKTPLLYNTQEPLHKEDHRFHKYLTDMDRKKLSSMKQLIESKSVELPFSKNMENELLVNLSDPSNEAAGQERRNEQNVEKTFHNREKQLYWDRTTAHSLKTTMESYDVVTERTRNFNDHFQKLNGILSKQDPHSLSQVTNLQNTSESLILKELAQSVIRHSKTVKGNAKSSVYPIIRAYQEINEN